MDVCAAAGTCICRAYTAAAAHHHHRLHLHPFRLKHRVCLSAGCRPQASDLRPSLTLNAMSIISANNLHLQIQETKPTSKTPSPTVPNNNPFLKAAAPPIPVNPQLSESAAKNTVAPPLHPPIPARNVLHVASKQAPLVGCVAVVAA